MAFGQKAKYVRTKDDEIIIFPAFRVHSSFRHLEPISAGFISFGINSNGDMTCQCFGESISLNLESLKDDTLLAKFQLGLESY
jgi:hypothetical protein